MEMDSGTPVRHAREEAEPVPEPVGKGADTDGKAGAARGKTKAGAELRELIRENDQRLYDFCGYMLGPGAPVDELILEIFREFGEIYRRSRRAWEPVDAKLRLFQVAWDRLRDTLALQQPAWVAGRDTRPMKGADDDLLGMWGGKRSDPTQLRVLVAERLARLDPEFRAPLVLRDVLGFEDEAAVRLLGLRWGVYRHRLHRGRLECRDALRGRSMPAGTKA